MQIHSLIIPTFVQMLNGLAAQLRKASAHAAAQQWEASALLEARLAPDMFPLAMQVAFVCTQAREAVLRLTGQPVTGPLPGGKSFADLEAQIVAAAAFVSAAAAADLDAAAERTVELVMPNGITFAMTGEQFVRDWALPQFYFHCVTAYAILRHIGVALGKPDFVAHMFAYLQPPPTRTP